MFEEDSAKSICESSIHTDYMKHELLKDDSPLAPGSLDRKLLEYKIAKIESTCDSLCANIELVKQEFEA